VSQPQPHQHTSSIFDADDPVIGSHPLLTGAAVPRFGVTDQWNLNGVIRRPARLPACAWTLVFSDELTQPAWNLLAREISMILFNPHHPAVTTAGLSLKPAPAHPTTVISELSHLRRIARWAHANDITAHLSGWQEHDLRRLVADLREQLSVNSVRHYIGTLKMLHHYGPALTGGGLRVDPWAGLSSRQAAHTRQTATVSTPVIPPQQWFASIRGAWTYVHTFAPDILRAHQRHQQLLGQTRAAESNCDAHLDDWLADRINPIPLHPSTDGADMVNWALLGLMLGWTRSTTANALSRRRGPGLRRIARIEQAIADGHPTTTGVIDDLAVIEHADGTTAPWHPGLSPRAIGLELRMLRNASYLIVIGLSMMRDSEVNEITRGSIVEHYGTPAIKSAKGKHDPNLPTKHWWITTPVAEAITVAEQLSTNHQRLFPPLLRKTADVARSHQMLDAFIDHVNTTRDHTGLQSIPAGKTRPHMFRRTMAMLTDQFPGSEIALGIQLKHIASRALANRSTQGYANADDSWAEHLESAIDAARFRRIEDLYHAHKTGAPIGYGPGADRITQTFNSIQHTVQARGGDATVERAMLRNSRLSIRFGVLNHCAMDHNNPAGAACLENAVIPHGHQGPLQDRCRPDRCANSIIAAEHIPIWTAQRHTLLTLIATPGLSTCRKAVLERELTDVDTVLNRTVSTSKEPE
jgi:integrase